LAHPEFKLKREEEKVVVEKGIIVAAVVGRTSSESIA
jgi:hypothetical protein